MDTFSRRMVRTAIFVYDCSRLLLLVSLLTSYLTLSPGPFQGGVTVFPYMLYAAPNALFPLMSFFLLFRFEASRLYIPLYTTGKLLCFLCLLLWFFLTVQTLKAIVPRSVLWAVFIGATDLGSAMGMILLYGVVQESAAEGKDLPAPVTETMEGG